MYVPDDVDPTDGEAIPCDPLIICQGDFVDVCVGFDIVTKYGHNGELNVQVHLNIQHVLLLESGVNIRRVRNLSSSPRITEQIPGGTS